MSQDTSETRRESIPSGSEILPLVEETVRIEKRQVSGKVRISTRVETFDETVKAELEGEAVEVTRVPIDRVVTEAPDIRTEGDVTIMPVLEEVLFVEKRLVLKEELHIRRRVTTETVDIPVTLRRERASIERVASGAVNTEEERTDDL